MDIEIEETASFEKKNEHRDLVSHMTAKLENVELPEESKCCIYKVPQNIREIHKEAYTPQLVSIGPLHYGDTRLESMEELKLGYLKRFLQRTCNKLEDCIQKLKEKEEHIRSCYAHVIPQSSDDFVKMILIDACFIIEYLYRCHNTEVWFVKDPILSQPWMKFVVELDLILLENQLPFFVLEDLFTTTCVTGKLCSFLELSFQHFQSCYTSDEQKCYLPQHSKFTFNYFCEWYLKPKHPFEQVKVQHFTDLLRILYLPPHRIRPERVFDSLNPLYSASQLLEAGVQMQVGKKNSIIEIEFAKNVLKIPCLKVFESTEVLLRNIVALERCHYPFESYVIDYIILLNFLIDTTKDVDILVDKGIMVNLLGDNNKLATMVNHLCIGIVSSTTSVDYLSLVANLNGFYDKPFNKYKAIFIHDYFSTPWKIASFIAAIVLLVLTLIQAICSVVSLL